MAHITLPEGLPGISGLLAYRPETARPLSELAEALLVAPSSLERGERELIAAHVSYLNECVFCHNSHAAGARHLLADGAGVVDAVRCDYRSAPISDKLKALLAIAAKVRGDARQVSADDVAEARRHGATDLEIHDTVLIAAAFCMFNRYVDGLATWTPNDPALYDAMGERLARMGYARRAPGAAQEATPDAAAQSAAAVAEDPAVA